MDREQRSAAFNFQKSVQTSTITIRAALLVRSLNVRIVTELTKAPNLARR